MRVDNKINYLEKKEINIGSLIKYHQDFKKAQQIFKSERDNVFTEEINKIALSSNYGKRMQ